MSAHHHSTTATGHGEPHVLPLKIYFGVAGALMVFTVITYLAAQVDFGPMNMVVALGIAVFKASLVALYFMHLRYDNKMYAIILLASLLFLGVFIAFTMFDTMRRDGIYDEKSHPINSQAEIYKSPSVNPAPVPSAPAPSTPAGH